jgi:hypothetical protein
MKLVARRLAWLLPLALSACAHNVKQTQMQVLAPPLEDTPPPPDISPNALPAPVYTIPKTPPPVTNPPEPAKTVPRHHRPSVKTASNATPGAAAQPGQVAEDAPADVPATGKFETPETPDLKKQAENSINDVERGLNGIGRKLNESEEKTSTQIREYLKQARTLLSSGDIEGASTVATKAKALLGELVQ